MSVISLKSFVFSEIVPLPAPENELNPAAVFEPYDQAVDNIAAAPATTDDLKLLDLSLKVFENDASRRASIDSRAGGMMSAIALAATLVTGVGFTILKDAGSLPLTAFWMMFMTFVLTLAYLTATIVRLFQIQGRVYRSTLDPTDLDPVLPPLPNEPSAYPSRVAARILRYTISNYKINNRVVDRLWAAQKCFRNALLVLVIGGLLTTINLILIPSNTGAERGLRLAQALARGAGCTDLPSLTMDRKGRWHGTCLLGGTPVSVFVDGNGRTSILP